MKTSKKQIGILSILVCILLVTVSFAGCAKKAYPQGQAPTKTGEKVKLDVVSWWDINKEKPLQEIKEAFEKAHPNIELNFIQVPSKGYYDKLLTMIAGGQPPDIAMLAMDQYPAYVEKGALTCLDRWITDDYKKDLWPVALKILTYKGSIYGVPRDLTCNVMYYNKKLFDEAKVPYPKEGWTWNDFLDICQKLTKRDGSGKVIQWGYHYAGYPDAYYDWLLQNNGGFVSEDGKRCILTNPESIEALQFLVDLRYKYKVAPTPEEAKQFGESSIAPFESGKVAMFTGGASRMFSLTKAGLDYDVAPLPKGKRQATRVFAILWVMPKGCKHPEEAWKVLSFLGGKEGQQLVVNTGMGNSALKSTDNSKFLTPPPANKKVFIDSFNYGEPFPMVKNREVWKEIEQGLDLMWLGKQPVKEAAEAVAKKVDMLLKE
ncbi:multiple sugar transport system substrate-binding protein [Thermanaeromonas toyohensis ToBE]|uniref:Multiple sugar transport system substrate-binding protein n=1 Tax=Thermanaeromonas toyohensis ToBE TaxID=698762 RepID=A0A1W1VVJ8_9FIRM|nr:sugar ABC transporter substrate-binding protein [Thermanaeromonas toyohensis]SMB97402.1 multiple sugar transport system substrate-binding protein [Thermanaeromonas toyohensis ToBE]